MLRLNFRSSGRFSRFFSSQRARPSPLLNVKPQQPVEEKEDAFFVVRKGSNIGLYRNLSDSQSQASSSICDPPVSVYKGYSLKKETEEYFAACGLKGALYTLNAKDLKEDLFGTLVPCSFQEPVITTRIADITEKTSLTEDELFKEQLKLENPSEQTPVSDNSKLCFIEFRGVSKGNASKGGAGAIIRAKDGSVIFQLREGLGAVNKNIAEYRALILGMRHALKEGFKHIYVQGDSQLVCDQVQGLCKTKNKNLASLCKEAQELKEMFISFHMSFVKKGQGEEDYWKPLFGLPVLDARLGPTAEAMNSAAAVQANLAVDLAEGEIYEQPGDLC